MQKILVLDSQVDEFSRIIENKNWGDCDLKLYSDKIKSVFDIGSVREFKAENRKRFIEFCKENEDIIFHASREMSRRQDIFSYYINIQSNCCPICGGELGSGSSYLFMNTIHDVLVGKKSFMDLSSIENASLPLFDPRAQFLICPSCFRASRNHISLSGNGAGQGGRAIAWYNPYNISRIPFVVSEDGMISSNLIGEATAGREDIDANIFQFNLNNNSLVRARRDKFCQTISMIEKIVSGGGDGSNEYAYAILDPRQKYSLTRYSAVWKFFNLPPYGVKSEESHAKFLFTDAAIYLGIRLSGGDNNSQLMRDAEENIKDCVNNFCESSRVEVKNSSYEVACNYFVGEFISNLKGAGSGEKLSKSERSKGKSIPACPPRFIRKFEITNFRGFSTNEAVDLEAKGSEEAATAMPPLPNAAFLADNAGGKTRILQALAWALMGREDVKNLRQSEPPVPDYLLPAYNSSGSGAPETKVRIWFFDRPEDEYLEVVFGKGFLGDSNKYQRKLGGGDYDDRIPFLPFGSNRNPSLSNTPGVMDPLLPCLQSIFFRDKHVPHPLSLVGFAELLELGKGHGQIVVNTLLNFLLDFGTQTNLVKVETGRDGKIEFKHDGNEFESLSEGLQSVATLAIYIMLGLKAKMKEENTGCSENFTSSMAGIVLMDELDAHLHPRWRRQILRQLQAVFPNVQFLFTTHDPVVLRGMPAHNVLRIEPLEEASRKTYTLQPLSDTGSLAGYEIDDLLISMLFNLDSTRDGHDRDGYREYIRLAVENFESEEKTGDSVELARLRQIYGAERLGFRHPTDRLLLPALDLLMEEGNMGNKQGGRQSNSPSQEQVEQVKDLLVKLWSL